VIKWAVVVLAALSGGWMVFDGTRALTVGDYVTVDGQLGPWAGLVERLGIDPRSTGMKASFVAYGAAWLVATALYARDGRRSRAAMAAFAAGSSWYLVAGTVSSAVQLTLLAFDRRRGS
jgi:hypothetical protein